MVSRIMDPFLLLVGGCGGAGHNKDYRISGSIRYWEPHFGKLSFM